MDSDKQKDVSGGAIFSGNANNSGTEPNAISSGSIAADTQAAGMPHSFSAHRPTKVIANVPGDIILTPQIQKKSKKGLIAAIISGIVLIAGLSIFLIVYSSKQSDLREAFNRFANFVISGEESINEIPQGLQEGTNYRIYSIIYTVEDKQKSYFVKLKELSSQLTNTVNGSLSGSENKKQITELVESTMAWQEAFMLSLEIDEGFNRFSSDQSSDSIDKDNDLITTLLKSTNENIRLAGESLQTAQNFRAALYGSLIESGCTIDNLNDGCLSQASTTAAINERIANFETSIESAKSAASSALRETLPTMWDLGENL